jgi:hypothetical protein
MPAITARLVKSCTCQLRADARGSRGEAATGERGIVLAVGRAFVTKRAE